MPQKPKYNGYRTPTYLDPDLCYVGDPIRASIMGGARNNLMWCRTWMKAHQLAAYVGPPDLDDNGNLDSDFYIIHDLPAWTNNGGTSDYRYLSGRAWLWEYDTTGLGGGGGNTVTQTANWYIDKDDIAANQKVWADASYTDTTATPLGKYPPISKNLGYLPINSDGGFLVSKMDTSGYLFASLGFLYVPDQFISENDYDDMELGLQRYKFRPGRICKGYDKASTAIGAVAKNMKYISLNADDGVYSSRRCLFQTPFPRGIYLEDTPAYVYIRSRNWNAADYPFKWKIKRANHKGGATDVKVLPAFVVTTEGNVGHSIKCTSVETASTWEWTSTGAAAFELIQASDGKPATGLTCDPDADEVIIEIKTGVAASAMAVHNVSAFEQRIAF